MAKAKSAEAVAHVLHKLIKAYDARHTHTHTVYVLLFIVVISLEPMRFYLHTLHVYSERCTGVLYATSYAA